MDHTPDSALHPTTLAVVQMLRQLLVVDPAATMELLSHHRYVSSKAERIKHLLVEMVKVPPGSVPATAVITSISVLGLINSVLRAAGADTIGAVVERDCTISDFVGSLRPATTSPNQEVVVPFASPTPLQP